MINYIKLTDETTGRAARCSVRFHNQAAAEIDADALTEWARRVRLVRFVRRAIAATVPACFVGLSLSTPSEFACGLYVSNENGTPCAWVEDGCDI